MLAMCTIIYEKNSFPMVGKCLLSNITAASGVCSLNVHLMIIDRSSSSKARMVLG